MANKKISELSAASALGGTELIETVQGGVNVQTTTQGIADLGTGVDHWIGTWDPTGNVLPDTGDGGNGTGGAPLAGDEWVLIADLTLGGNFYATGTMIKAKSTSPGQTVSNWIFISTQL